MRLIRTPTDDGQPAWPVRFEHGDARRRFPAAYRRLLALTALSSALGACMGFPILYAVIGGQLACVGWVLLSLCVAIAPAIRRAFRQGAWGAALPRLASKVHDLYPIPEGDGGLGWLTAWGLVRPDGSILEWRSVESWRMEPGAGAIRVALQTAPLSSALAVAVRHEPTMATLAPADTGPFLAGAAIAGAAAASCFQRYGLRADVLAAMFCCGWCLAVPWVGWAWSRWLRAQGWHEPVAVLINPEKVPANAVAGFLRRHLPGREDAGP